MPDDDDRAERIYARLAYEGVARALEEERRAADRQAAALRAELGTQRQEAEAARRVAAEVTRLARGLIGIRAPRRRLLLGLRAWRAERGSLRRAIDTIGASALWDRDWYLRQYPDVARSGQDPASHYLRFGAAEGRDPGPAFSTGSYLLANPDVATSAVNPLVHYEMFGRAEGRMLHPPACMPAARLRRDIVFVSGEPGTAGHVYRIRRPAEAAAAVGLSSLALSMAEAASDMAALDADIVVIWRAEWSQRVAGVIAQARGFCARIVFDCDDLMVEPDLARFEFIDGIRTQFLTEQVVSDFYGRVQQTLLAADACLSPTAFLTGRMQRFGKPGFVLPNGFDETTRRVSQAAVAARQAAGARGVLRIGYAGGTRTHQKDFAVIAAPVARVLREAGNRRLVLFRRAETPCLDLEEFPALAGLEAQIEWREMVGLEELPWELARFDVNVAPLEVGNPYCEAKSELKFFEAALVGVPTIASPTQPFRDAIRDGQNGYLAANEAEWYDRLTILLGDGPLRQLIARAAREDAEEKYGAARRGEIVGTLVRSLS